MFTVYKIFVKLINIQIFKKLFIKYLNIFLINHLQEYILLIYSHRKIFNLVFFSFLGKAYYTI